MDSKVHQRAYPQQVVEEYSPSIPKEFPKEKIPKNLCEKELIKMIKCERIFQTNYACVEDYEAFVQCKKQRDLELFKSIKEWEIDHFQKLQPHLRKLYFQGLTFKKDRLKQDYERIPSSFSYQNRQWRFMSDIEQIEWRLGYLKPIRDQQ
ncbi:hypothetical protein ABPG72_006364 [Tetrahymena utriculariae]